MLTDFEILSQAESTVNLQYIFIENASMPCDLSIITIPALNCRLFSGINISEVRSVATCLRYGGIFSYYFTYLSLSLMVK